MKYKLALLLSCVATLACAEHYGAPITMRNPVSLDVAVSQLGEKTAADVLVESKVDKVCAAAGCWIGLKSASGSIHVTFKDEAFHVPLTLMGKTVVAQGRLSKIAMTLEQTRQYVEDSGGDVAAVKQPAVRYEFVASGIEVKA